MPDSSPARVLIADDQADVLNALRLLLLDEGFEVIEARAPAEAVERIEVADFDLAILDLNYARDTTSGQEGFDLIERIRLADASLPVLVMTAWSSVPARSRRCAAVRATTAAARRCACRHSAGTEKALRSNRDSQM